MFSRSVPLFGLSCGVLIGLACGDQPTNLPTEDPGLEASREVPYVEGFEPMSGIQGARVALSVQGENFDVGSRVDLLLFGSTVNEVQTLSTRFVTGQELVADISIADDAPVGAYQVQVTTSEGKRGIPIEDFVIGESGSLQVAIATTGGPEDPSGYTLTVDASSRSVAVNDTATFDPLAAGPHIVRIDGLAAHCTVEGENPRTVTVAGGTVAQTSFTVACVSGSIVGTVSVDGFPIAGGGTINGGPTEIAAVALSGPADRATSTGHDGHFGFHNLPAGTYTLTAHDLTRLFIMPTTVFPLACESNTVTVQASQTVEANISCTIPQGNIGGTVTINGEARPIVWVELQFASSGFPWAFDTTIPNGGWGWEVPATDYVVVIKPPPGLTCDATSKSASVRQDQTTIVNFACVGEVKGSIQGFTTWEFGTLAFARVTLTGPVNLETISNADGFFAFEDLPPGDYVVARCSAQSVTVQDGANAYVMVDCS